MFAARVHTPADWSILYHSDSLSYTLTPLKHALATAAASTPSSSVLTPNSSLMRHPDRGAGFYHKKRERFGRASLIETGR